MINDVYTISELAEVLKIGEAKAWRMIENGEIPSLRLGPRSPRVMASSLNRWLRDREKSERQKASPPHAP